MTKRLTISEKDARRVARHYGDIMGKGFRSLTEGQTVQFEIVKTSKGLKAESVEVVA